MSDDTDLIRLFAEEAILPADEDFVTGVTARIAWRKRLILAAPFGAALLLLLAIWPTWPAASTFSGNALVRPAADGRFARHVLQLAGRHGRGRRAAAQRRAVELA